MSIPGFSSEKVVFQGKTLRVEALPHGVKNLILSRPDLRNAFDAGMISEMAAALAELAATRDCNDLRVLLVTGEGKAFCAGADLNYMKDQAAQNHAANVRDARELGRLFFKLASFPTPVVAAVQGAAIGGGLGLTVCADFVIAEDSAVFATSEVLLGIVPGVISPYIVRKLGLANAAPLMLTGTRLSASDALNAKLVQKIVPNGELEKQTAEVLKEFLKAGPNAARRTKALLKNISPLPSPDLFEVTVNAIADARTSDEGQAGLNAFFEKKAPPWQGV